MKKLFMVFAVLVLAACIDVDDFGTTWDKTSLDPALQGEWARIPAPGEDIGLSFPAGEKIRFVVKNGAYELRSYVEGEKDKKPDYPVKTLTTGPYRFLAFGPKEGSIIKYTITDGVMTVYRLDFFRAWNFIQQNYPGVKNIVREDSDEAPIKIKYFDDEVYKILSNIPNEEIYWYPANAYKKIKATAGDNRRIR
jgi:hypothetical protein